MKHQVRDPLLSRVTFCPQDKRSETVHIRDWGDWRASGRELVLYLEAVIDKRYWICNSCHLGLFVEDSGKVETIVLSVDSLPKSREVHLVAVKKLGS